MTVTACGGQDSTAEPSTEVSASQGLEDPTPVADPDALYVTEVRSAIDLLPEPLGEVVTDARSAEGDRRSAEIAQQLTLDLSTLAWDDVSSRLEVQGAALDEQSDVLTELLRLEADQVALSKGFEGVSDEDLLSWGRDVCQAASKGGRVAVHEWAVDAVASNLAVGIEEAPQASFVEEFDLVATHLCPEWFK